MDHISMNNIYTLYTDSTDIVRNEKIIKHAIKHNFVEKQLLPQSLHYLIQEILIYKTYKLLRQCHISFNSDFSRLQ